VLTPSLTVWSFSRGARNSATELSSCSLRSILRSLPLALFGQRGRAGQGPWRHSPQCVGVEAPDFNLPGSSATEQDRKLWLSPASLALGWCSLLYLKDFAGGCTLEARGFRSHLGRFHSLGAEVIGVSADSAEQHQSFCSSEALSFPLLSDRDGRVSRVYGSWIPSFSQRHTFLLNPAGGLQCI